MGTTTKKGKGFWQGGALGRDEKYKKSKKDGVLREKGI